MCNKAPFYKYQEHNIFFSQKVKKKNTLGKTGGVPGDISDGST